MAKYRILVIDDDEDARRMLRLALRERYEVVEACDGLDALSKLTRYEPDFAIIDIMMPLMDGYQVCESIRRTDSCRSIPVLFLSAYGSKENIKRGYAAGANLFMTKPVDPMRVLKNIDFTIDHDPPALRRKLYTLEQIDEMERAEAENAKQAAAKTRAAAQAAADPKAGHAAPPPPNITPPDPNATLVYDEDEEVEIKRVKPTAAPVGMLTPRVLIVDDDAEIVHMLDLALRDQFEITSANDGLEAIQRIVEYEPDLMILDIMMPKMNGYQLLQSIRRNQFYKDLPVMVLSAKSTPRDREYAAKLGANIFVAKPYVLQELAVGLAKITDAKTFHVKKKRMTLAEIKMTAAADDKLRAKKPDVYQKKKYADIQSVIDEGRKG